MSDQQSSIMFVFFSCTLIRFYLGVVEAFRNSTHDKEASWVRSAKTKVNNKSEQRTKKSKVEQIREDEEPPLSQFGEKRDAPIP